MLFPPIPILQYITLLILIQTPSYLSSNDKYTDCASLYDCGKITNIGFPFWGENRPKGCGHPLLHLNCHNSITYITIKDVEYQVLEAIPDNQILRMARVDYFQGLCPSKFLNTSLDPELFVYNSEDKNLTLFYGCLGSNDFPSFSGHVNCFLNGTSDEYFYTQFGAQGPPVFCTTSVVVPVSISLQNINDFTYIQEAIREGFSVRWIAGIEECVECEKSGGVCGYDWSSNQTTCYCRDQSTDSVTKTCTTNSTPNDKASPQSRVPPVQGMYALPTSL